MEVAILTHLWHQGAALHLESSLSLLITPLGPASHLVQAWVVVASAYGTAFGLPLRRWVRWLLRGSDDALLRPATGLFVDSTLPQEQSRRDILGTLLRLGSLGNIHNSLSRQLQILPQHRLGIRADSPREGAS